MLLAPSLRQEAEAFLLCNSYECLPQLPQIVRQLRMMLAPLTSLQCWSDNHNLYRNVSDCLSYLLLLVKAQVQHIVWYLNHSFCQAVTA